MTSKWKYFNTQTDAVYLSFIQLRGDKKAAHRAFWIWMESIFKREREFERQSIIELLKEHQPSALGRELGICPCTCGYDSPDIDLTQHHITLIEERNR
jgi:hypothetical protein